MRNILTLAIGLLAAAPALAVDAHYPRYEEDVYRSRQDMATVGLVVSVLGLTGGAAGLVTDKDTLSDIFGVQGTLFLAGGGTITALAGLSARAYPLEKRLSLAPGTAAIGLAGLSGVGLIAWAANDDPDLDDPLLYGSMGVGAASTVAAIGQLAVNGAAWSKRKQARQSNLQIGLAPVPGGMQVFGQF